MGWKVFSNDGELYVLHMGTRLCLKETEVREAWEILQALKVQAESPAAQAELQWEEPQADKPKLDFEMIYRMYPRKMGKASGLKWLREHVKSEKTFQELLGACNNYVHHLEQERVEEKFIKWFSTWVKTWRDWLPDNAGKVRTVDVGELTFRQ